MNQWLLHNILLRRALLALARPRSLSTQNSSPERGFNVISTKVSSRPRLGEPFSPKRVYLSLNTLKLLAWVRSRAHNVQVSSRPRIGEPFSPEWDCVSLNSNVGRLSELLDPKPWMNSCNSRLGEKESLGRNLQSFATVQSRKQPKPYPKLNRYNTKHSISTINLSVYIFTSNGTTQTQHLINYNHSIPKTLTLIIRMHSMSLHTISTNQILSHSTCHTKFLSHRMQFIKVETQYSPKNPV